MASSQPLLNPRVNKLHAILDLLCLLERRYFDNNYDDSPKFTGVMLLYYLLGSRGFYYSPTSL